MNSEKPEALRSSAYPTQAQPPDRAERSGGATSPNRTGRTGTLRVTNPVQLGMAIRHIRHETGMSQAELANRCGIHASYLSELERGNVTEQTERILRILRRLGATLHIEVPDATPSPEATRAPEGTPVPVAPVEVPDAGHHQVP